MTTQQNNLSRRSAIALTAGGFSSLLFTPPAHAVQNFRNSAIADAGWNERGSRRATGWNQPGECIKSVQRWVSAAGGYLNSGGVITGYTSSGALEVSLSAATKGDIIQYTNPNGNNNDWYYAHTVVVIKNHGNGTYDIVQSNDPDGSGLVTAPTNWRPSPRGGWISRVWRLGTVDSSSAPSQGGSIGYNSVRVGTALTTGQRLTTEQYITTPDGTSALKMQSDGNLVLYGPHLRVLWATNTAGNPGSYLGMQGDGNMVLYSGTGRVLWTTNPRGITKLILQNDGNLVARDVSGAARWASDTVIRNVNYLYQGTDRLSSGMRLQPGQYVSSGDRRFQFLMKPDGNLVLYGPAYNVTWATNTAGNPGSYLGMQGDGNMVLYSGTGRVLWTTNPRGITKLILQNDGNLVARDVSGAARWASDTNGRI